MGRIRKQRVRSAIYATPPIEFSSTEQAPFLNLTSGSSPIAVNTSGTPSSQNIPSSSRHVPSISGYPQPRLTEKSSHSIEESEKTPSAENSSQSSSRYTLRL